ncbi:hypothetical protein LCGC14_1522430 [marine sediment metagenome]|uniref:Uncharacterized protein n=1 Tax=marine sediment metagenome TaxID=412755 RepID=A0A0F9IYI0_9ZZZZ
MIGRFMVEVSLDLGLPLSFMLTLQPKTKLKLRSEQKTPAVELFSVSGRFLDLT